MKKPKYKIGDIVFVKSVNDSKKILQGRIYGAEYVTEWFYWIKAINVCGGENQKEDIYTYEVDTRDAKTEIVMAKND